MRRAAVLLCLVISASACGTSGGNDRTVLVDYSHDEFASFMIANFPGKVAVPADSAVVFKQIWTGEPHTVTGGTLVDEMMIGVKDWIPFFESFDALLAEGLVPNPERPEGSFGDVLEAIESSDAEPARTEFLESYDAIVGSGSDLPPRDAVGDITFEEVVEIVDQESEGALEDSGLPWALDENDEGAYVTQNAGQPCYLSDGGPPEDADEPCRDAQQQQPDFDGTQSYYNSGIIPYEGPQGNTFRVEIAADTKPGSYFFYCAVHGPSQFTEVEVRPPGSKVPSQREVTQQAQEEIAAMAEPMKEFYDQALDGTIEVEGEELNAPFAGLSPPVHGSINEFVPKVIKTRVGEPVRWKLMGSDHSVSFSVPRYFPIITFAKDGRVALNRRLEDPAGGSPEIPEQEGRGVLRVDGGTYDGTGFFSSGLFGGEPYAEYTLRFSEPGTYKYACLLHPPMVGTVEVT